MTKTKKGVALFWAQFAGDEPPFNTLEGIAKWTAAQGFKGAQLPGWDSRFIDVQKCAESQTAADEVKGKLNDAGLEPTEIALHPVGQLMCCHPAYHQLFDEFAPDHLKGKPNEWPAWVTQMHKWAMKASQRMGLTAVPTFPGTLIWPYVYPWPQRPKGLVEEAFKVQAARWKPVFDYGMDECDGVVAAYETHPMEDIHDGDSYEMFLGAVDNHPGACLIYDPSHFVLQQLDYLAFIDLYHDRIKAYHAKDAEFHASGRGGVYGGFQPWVKRAGRFRSIGDGQVDFKRIASKFAQYGINVWANVEWECCLKEAADGAAESVPLMEKLFTIQIPSKAFDDFADSGADIAMIQNILGVAA